MSWRYRLSCFNVASVFMASSVLTPASLLMMSTRASFTSLAIFLASLENKIALLKKTFIKNQTLFINYGIPRSLWPYLCFSHFSEYFHRHPASSMGPTLSRADHKVPWLTIPARRGLGGKLSCRTHCLSWRAQQTCTLSSSQAFLHVKWQTLHWEQVLAFEGRGGTTLCVIVPC